MTAHDDIQTIRTVGFIGLGSMGLPMALNLLKAGFVVRGHSRSAERTRLFTEAGGIDAPDLGSILEKADAIITMVPDGDVVEELMEAPDGIAARAPRGCLMLDMSTIAPDQARGLAARCRDLGIDFLDAPVSGGTKGARDGSLTIMVGGEEATFAKAQPLLSAMGTTITHMGQEGSGQVTKAANQLMVGGALAVLSEAIILLEHNGVNPVHALGALSQGLAGSRILDLKGEASVSRSFSPTFTIRLHSKDMGIVQSTARSSGCCLPTASSVAQLFTAAEANGWTDLDHSAVLKVIELLSGTSSNDQREEQS